VRQLIWKDFVVQKRTAYVYLAMGFLFFFYFDAMDQRNMLSVMIPVFVIVYSFANRSLLEDERNHTIRMLLCLPVQRSVLVKAKYLSIFLVALVATIVFTVIGAGFGLFSSYDQDELLINLFIVAGCMLCYTIIVSIFIPLVYKIGIVRAQTINRFVFFGFMILGTTMGALITFLKSRFDFSGSPPAWVDWMGSTIENMNPYAGLVFLFSLSALIFIGSMLLAIRIFNRREVF
jgi:ABC-2 type transport system permease protein